MSILGSIVQSTGGGGGGGVGVSVNEETLAANKTILDGDPNIQILDTNSASLDLTLPATPTEGSWWQITNACIASTGTGTLNIKIGVDTSAMYSINGGATVTFAYSANGWVCFGDGTSVKRIGANSFELDNGIAIGRNARGYPSSSTEANTAIAIGRDSSAINSIMIGGGTNSINGANTFVGNSISGSGSYKTCIGASSYGGGDYTVSVGYQSTPLANSSCLGARADAGATYQTVLGYQVTGSTRVGALVKGVFIGSTLAKNEELGWVGSTTDATLTEIFLGGSGATRAILAANSLVGFEIQVVAREAATQDCKFWTLTGAIKRDGSNNTSLVGTVTKTVVGADAGASAWDVTVDADDTNESIRVQVTGEAAHTISWASTARILDRR